MFFSILKKSFDSVYLTEEAEVLKKKKKLGFVCIVLEDIVIIFLY